MMKLEVRLDGRLVYDSSFQMCREDAVGFTQEKQGDLVFTLKAPREIVWTGYKEEDDKTKAAEEIKGTIWEAGGETWGLILGAYFQSRDTSLMNTLIGLEAKKRSETGIAKGLTVTTYPITGIGKDGQSGKR